MRVPFALLVAVALIPGCSSDSELSSDPFRLCSWNVERLGYESGKDFVAMARVLEEHCDAAVLLEVMRTEGDAPGYEALLDELGEAWIGARTDEAKPETADYAEYAAIVWRKDLLAFCDGSPGLEFVPDGARGEASDHFDREPAFGCFRLKTGRFDFLLGGYHANWDDSVLIVQDEVRFVDDAVRSLQAAWPDEGDLLLFGDFNLTPQHLAEVTALTIFGSGDGSTLNASGERTRNLYDNLLVASLSATPELVDRALVLDVREETGSPEYYAAHVSDHLPIQVLLHPSSEDDD